MKSYTVAAALLVAALIAAPAYAGCKGSDIKRKTFTAQIITEGWATEDGNRAADLYTFVEMASCTFKTNGKGRLSDRTCYDSNDNPIGYVQDGKLSVNSSCQVSGWFSIGHNGGQATGYIANARMTRDKDMVVGNGEDDYDWDFSVTLIRH